MIKWIFRKQCLRKTKALPTAFLSEGKIRYVSVLIDTGEEGWKECAEEVARHCHEKHWDLNLVYLDTRPWLRSWKIGEERPRRSWRTDPDATFFRKDFNWWGKPRTAKMNRLKDNPCDLFINLTERTSFLSKYISIAANARFKIGRVDLEKDVFNVIVNEVIVGDGQREVFITAMNLLGKISD